LESPVLQREGVTKAIEGEAPTMEQWRKARTASYGVVDLKKSADTNVEYEIVLASRLNITTEGTRTFSGDIWLLIHTWSLFFLML